MILPNDTSQNVSVSILWWWNKFSQKQLTTGQFFFLKMSYELYVKIMKLANMDMWTPAIILLLTILRFCSLKYIERKQCNLFHGFCLVFSGGLTWVLTLLITFYSGYLTNHFSFLCFLPLFSKGKSFLYIPGIFQFPFHKSLLIKLS